MTPPPRPALATLPLTALLALALGTVPVSAQTTITYADAQVDPTARSTSAPNDPLTLAIAAGSATQSGEITGTGGLIKSGAGTLVLSAANAYSGPTLIEAGQLQFVIPSGGSTNLMSDFTVNAGATLSMGSIYLAIGSLAGDGTVALGSNYLGVGLNGRVTTFSGSITGNGALYVLGGDLTLTGDSPAHTGSTVMTPGSTLRIGAGGNTGSVGRVDLSYSTLIFNRSDDYTYAGAVTGSGDVVKEGANILTLANGLSFNDSVSHVHVAAGTLRLGAYGTLANLIVDSGAVLDLNGFGATALTLEGAGMVQMSGSGLTVGSNYVDSVFSGTLTGTGSLTKWGTGTLTLGGSGNYSGATTITQGRLLLAADEVLGNATFLSVEVGGILDLGGHTETVTRVSGAGQIDLGSGRLIVANDGADLYLMGAISGSGGLTLAGPGALNLYGSNSFTGDTVLSEGNLVLGHAEALGSVGTIRFEGGTLRFTEANRLDYSGRFSQAAAQRYAIDTAGNAVSLGTALTSEGGSLTKLGPGTLTLGGANTYTGATTINGGTLSLAGGGSLPAGTRVSVADWTNFDLAGRNQVIAGLEGLGNVWLGAGQLTVNPSSGTSTFNGAISGSGVLVKSGAGTLALGGLNTYTGGTMLEAGTLLLTYAGGLPFSGPLTFTGGTLRYTAATAFDFSGRFSTADNQSFRFDTNSQSLTFASALTSTGGTLTKLGAGTLTLGAANSYTGGTTLAGGTLSLAHAGALGASGPISFEGGTLQFAAANTADYSARFSAAAGQAYLIDTNGQSVSFGSALTSAGGSLTKSGAGTLILGGNNSYSGSTTVAGGTLLANGNYATGTGALTVQSGATLGGNGYIAGPTTILSGGTLAPGNPDSPGTLTFGNNADLILNSGSILNFRLGTAGAAGGPTNDLVTGIRNLTLDGLFNVTGAPTFGAGSYRIFDYSGTLTDQTLDLGSLPFGFTYALQTNVANQVNLVATIVAGSTPFWDGSVTTGTGMIAGGTGTWNNTTANFTSSDGLHNMAWDGTLAIFAGTAGTVTLGESVSFTGMQFSTTGYSVVGSGSNYLNLMGNATIRTDPGVTATISAQMNGSGSLTKIDSGTLELTGRSYYTGGTWIDGGTLRGNLPDKGDLAVATGATYDLAGRTQYIGSFSGGGLVTLGSGNLVIGFGAAGPGIYSFTGSISGSGAVDYLNATDADYNLTGNNTYTGGTRLLDGTIALGSAGALGDTGTLTMGGGVLKFTAANTTDYSARFSTIAGQRFCFDTNGQSVTFASPLISSSGDFEKTGAGTLTLAGKCSDDFFRTRITQGTLAVGADNVLPDSGMFYFNAGAILELGGHRDVIGSLNGAGGEIKLGGGQLIINCVGTNSFVGGVISGSGTVTMSGSGVLWVADNTYTGDTILAGGTLLLFRATGIGPTGQVRFEGGALDPRGYDISNRFSTASGQLYKFNSSASNSIGTALTSAGGSFTKLGTATVTLLAANTYDGGTTISQGALQVGGGGTTGSITGNVVNNADLIFNRSNQVDFAGQISGTGRLIKRGTGELQLTSANNYEGGTLLQTGTLRVSNTTGSGLGTGSVNVSAGATLTGDGSFTGTLQLNGRIAPGNSPGTLATGSETWAGGASYLWEINDATGAAGTNWDLLTISGTLSLAATSGSPFTIYVRSLDAGGAAAPAANFLAASDYSFVFATASGGITGFSADQFFIDTSGFANPAGGSWSVEALSGTSLQLHYSAGGAAVPEPAAAAALLGLLALGIVVVARRTCRRDFPQ